MDKFTTTVIAIYIILFPFYIFRSGLPQPADFVIAIGLITFIFHKDFFKILKMKYFKKIKLLLFVIIIVNTINWFVLYAMNWTDNKIYFSSVYYLFNFSFIALMFYSIIADKRNINYIVWSIIISLSIQFLLAILGLSGGQKDTGARATLFFNNPNQLGYYTLLAISLFTILPSKMKSNGLLLSYVFFIAIYLALYSNSRAALGGLAILLVFIITHNTIKVNKSMLLVLLLVPFVIPSLYQSQFVQRSVQTLESRNQRDASKEVSQIEIRGYDKILLYPERIIFGAGEGHYKRFKTHSDYEIHSAYGTMLFAYGITGLILFLMIIYDSIKGKKWYGAIVLAPLLFYNLTHQGLRFPLFWGVLAASYLTLNYFENENYKKKLLIRKKKAEMMKQKARHLKA